MTKLLAALAVAALCVAVVHAAETKPKVCTLVAGAKAPKQCPVAKCTKAPEGCKLGESKTGVLRGSPAVCCPPVCYFVGKDGNQCKPPATKKCMAGAVLVSGKCACPAGTTESKCRNMQGFCCAKPDEKPKVCANKKCGEVCSNCKKGDICPSVMEYCQADGGECKATEEPTEEACKAKVCCEGLTASCQACAKGVTVAVFCKANPETEGCKAATKRPTATKAPATKAPATKAPAKVCELEAGAATPKQCPMAKCTKAPEGCKLGESKMGVMRGSPAVCCPPVCYFVGEDGNQCKPPQDDKCKSSLPKRMYAASVDKSKKICAAKDVDMDACKKAQAYTDAALTRLKARAVDCKKDSAKVEEGATTQDSDADRKCRGKLAYYKGQAATATKLVAEWCEKGERRARATAKDADAAGAAKSGPAKAAVSKAAVSKAAVSKSKEGCAKAKGIMAGAKNNIAEVLKVCTATKDDDVEVSKREALRKLAELKLKIAKCEDDKCVGAVKAEIEAMRKVLSSFTEDQKASIVEAKAEAEAAVVEAKKALLMCRKKTDTVVCCAAMTASCLACAKKVTVAEYCKRVPETSGCKAATKAPATTKATGGGAVCCRAMTAECLACAKKTTVAEYCKRLPETSGCKGARARRAEVKKAAADGGPAKVAAVQKGVAKADTDATKKAGVAKADIDATKKAVSQNPARGKSVGVRAEDACKDEVSAYTVAMRALAAFKRSASANAREAADEKEASNGDLEALAKRGLAIAQKALDACEDSCDALEAAVALAKKAVDAAETANTYAAADVMAAVAAYVYSEGDEGTYTVDPVLAGAGNNGTVVTTSGVTTAPVATTGASSAALVLAAAQKAFKDSGCEDAEKAKTETCKLLAKAVSEAQINLDNDSSASAMASAAATVAAALVVALM